MWTLKRSPCKLWEGARSPGGSSPSPGETGAWDPVLDSPPAHGGVRPAWAPALQHKSRRPGGQVLSQADLPPPPFIQFFLQATFSCVAAASCRVASSNCLVLAASSLRCGSCSGISCGRKEWFAAPATSPRFSARPPRRCLPNGSHLQHRLLPLLSRGHKGKQRGAHASPGAQHCAREQQLVQVLHGRPRDQRGDLWSLQ